MVASRAERRAACHQNHRSGGKGQRRTEQGRSAAANRRALEEIHQKRLYEMKRQFDMQSIPIIKDAHSPDGQAFYAPPSFADLPDCPVCKWGTPMERNGRLTCIDCGATVGTIDKQTK